ncbi:MAG: FAD-dependent monooxygenase [Bacteroidetes bacterium]|nr:FAD-dependent monooxygenase [Bacteroidota bacterium]
MQHKNKYPCAIVGGGLAGLCLAIQLADKGIKVVLFEKNTFPFHKVCGEYISMESWDFLCTMGLPLQELNLPKINQLGISSQKGFMLNTHLPLGGFGMSRFSLDNCLCELAKKKGVAIYDNCKVFDVKKNNKNESEVHTSKGIYTTRIVCGAYGKYSPSFMKEEKNKSLNYIGVKYHINTKKIPDNKIELHNFKGGYCGISKVDKETHCLCYLTDSTNLKNNANDLKKMEQNVLYKNPFLESYFTQSTFLFNAPLIISNIYFTKKNTYQNPLFLLGDAAGSITPLCGNGMSMAMRASKIMASLLPQYFDGAFSEEALQKQYHALWNQNFNTRITAGYYLQFLFGKNNTTHYALQVLNKTPYITKKIISLTHGTSF